MPVFETSRLIIRKAAVADVALYAALWNSPQVMRHVGFPQGLRITHADIEKKIEQRASNVFGALLVVELQANGQAIGECKMYLPDKAGIAHTDIKLLPNFWGQRYGVEIKRGLLDYLFKHSDCTAVSATPNINNIASIKMQEAVGGVRIGEDIHHFPEHMQQFTAPVHHYIYHVRRARWEQTRT